ncbi:MAG: hypothetical protein WCH98_19480, partial [Verrucomicrobiota bacterium]
RAASPAPSAEIPFTLPAAVSVDSFAPALLPPGHTFDLIPFHKALSSWFSPLRYGCAPCTKHST